MTHLWTNHTCMHRPTSPIPVKIQRQRSSLGLLMVTLSQPIPPPMVEMKSSCHLTVWIENPSLSDGREEIQLSSNSWLENTWKRIAFRWSRWDPVVIQRLTWKHLKNGSLSDGRDEFQLSSNGWKWKRISFRWSRWDPVIIQRLTWKWICFQMVEMRSDCFQM